MNYLSSAATQSDPCLLANTWCPSDNQSAPSMNKTKESEYIKLIKNVQGATAKKAQAEADK